MKAIQSILLLLTLSLTGFSQVYDQKMEKQKEQGKGVLSGLVSELGDRLTDSSLTEDQLYELFEPIVDYAEKEQSAFRQIRQKYFRQTPPPLETITNLSLAFERIDSDELINMLQDKRFAIVTLLQCYTPTEVANLISSLVQPYIQQSAGLGFHESSIVYMFGNQVFAKELEDNVWEIWSVNRSYILRFTLDLDNMVVSNPVHTQPNQPAYLQLEIPFVRHAHPYNLSKHWHKHRILRRQHLFFRIG